MMSPPPLPIEALDPGIGLGDDGAWAAEGRKQSFDLRLGRLHSSPPCGSKGCRFSFYGWYHRAYVLSFCKGG